DGWARVRSWASRLAVAVADAVERFDSVEIVVDDFEFLTQALDVAVDRAVIDIDLIVVGRVHQVVATFHKAGTLCEALKDQEFGDGETHGLAVPCAFVALRIQ